MAHYERSAPSRIFYGWWIAAAFSFIVFLSTGIRFAVGPFLKPVVSDLGLDRGTFSLVISLSLFLYGAFMPLVGPLADRWGSRLVFGIGAVVMAASLVLTGTMTSLWQFALYYGVLGALGLAATGQVVALATLTRWFARRRGTAVSLLSVASMAGMSLLVPIIMWCILHVGWRASYMILGVASLLVTLPLSIWVLRTLRRISGSIPTAACRNRWRRAGRRWSSAPQRLTRSGRRPSGRWAAAFSPAAFR
jgi:MFS family permease